MAIEDFGDSRFGQRSRIISADHQNTHLATKLARGAGNRSKASTDPRNDRRHRSRPIQEAVKEKEEYRYCRWPRPLQSHHGRCLHALWFPLAYDPQALAVGTPGGALVEAGGTPGSLLMTLRLARSATRLEKEPRFVLVNAKGARSVGSVPHSLNSSGFLLVPAQAQARSKIIAWPMPGQRHHTLDQRRRNSHRCAAKLRLPTLKLAEVHGGLGSNRRRGACVTEGFYGDQNDTDSRVPSERF